jgi:multidrug transporter EmrE-like cation transporter
MLAWLLALSRVPVSVAYPMLSLGYVITVLAAWLWFGEAVNAQRLGGVGLIVLGVFIVARS